MNYFFKMYSNKDGHLVAEGETKDVFPKTYNMKSREEQKDALRDKLGYGFKYILKAERS